MLLLQKISVLIAIKVVKGLYWLIAICFLLYVNVIVLSLFLYHENEEGEKREKGQYKKCLFVINIFISNYVWT